MADYVSTSQGRVGYALPQPYSALTAYQKRDVVQYQGGSYVVLEDEVQGIPPSDDGVHYRVLCQRGEAGESNAVWFAGTTVAGRGSGIVAGVPGSKAGDMYLNSDTSDLYSASAPDTWNWAMNIGETVNVAAGNVSTRDGGNVQAALDDLADRAAADIPTSDPGMSVQDTLDGLDYLTIEEIDAIMSR